MSLNAEQTAEQIRVVAELGKAIAAQVGVDAIAGYAVAMCRWREAEKHLGDEGAVVTVGTRSAENPWMRISATAARQMRYFQVAVAAARNQARKAKAKAAAKPKHPRPPRHVIAPDDMENIA